MADIRSKKIGHDTKLEGKEVQGGQGKVDKITGVN